MYSTHEADALSRIRAIRQSRIAHLVRRMDGNSLNFSTNYRILDQRGVVRTGAS